MVLLTAIVFIALLLVLVLAHEFGHFWAARRAGCRIEEFAFGFPPRLFSLERNGTQYSFNLLPVGGYVKIEGENMDEDHPAVTSFASKSAVWRVFILAAGVFMNVLLAIVLLSWQAVIGVPTLATEDNAHMLTDFKTYVLDIAPDSPAAAAGITAMDRFVRIGAFENPTVTDVQRVVDENLGNELVIEIERAGVHSELTLVPRVDHPPGEGPLGVALASTGLERIPWWRAPFVGVQRTWNMLVAIVTQFGLILGRLVSEGTVGETLTGPIGIAVYTNEVTTLGLSYLLEFAALISLNLALINILPFPALDGGRILFVLIETVSGRRVPGKIESIIHTFGFVLLIVLMIAITWRDVARFFG